NEDTAIAVNVSIALTDLDGSEQLDPDAPIRIIADNDAMAAGTLSLNGTPLTLKVEDGQSFWEIPASAFKVATTTEAGHPATYGIDGLTFTPAEHSDVDAGFTVEATVLDNGISRLTSQGSGTITVAPVADEIIITAGGSGNEDTAIAVNVSIALTDLDGSEQLDPDAPIRIIADNDVMAAGTLSLNGTPLTLKVEDGQSFWEIPASAFKVATTTEAGHPATYGIDGLTFTPAEHSDVDAGFTVEATVLDNGISRLTSQGSGTITVSAVADAPDLDVKDSGGYEHDGAGTGIPIAITDLSLVDTDGSEFLTVYVQGVPEGASLSMGEKVDGVTLSGQQGSQALAGPLWKITVSDPKQLEDLKVIPKAGSSADMDLKIIAVSEERNGGDQAWTIGEVHVDIGVLAPEVTVTPGAAGDEDSWISVTGLNARYPAPGDDDTVTITVRDLHEDAALRHVAEDGTVTELPRGPDGSYDVTKYWDPVTGTISGLEVRWKEGSGHENSADSITFTLRAYVVDSDYGTENFTAAGPDQDRPYADEAWHDAQVTVEVIPVADPARVVASGVGVEDEHVPLNLQVEVTDSSEIVNSIILTGLNGASLYKDGILQQEIEEGSGRYAISPDDLTGWTILPVKDWSGTLDLTLTVETKEPANGATLTEDHHFSLRVFGDADAPQGLADGSHFIDEDSFHQLVWGSAEQVQGGLADVFATLTDLDESETLSFRIEADLPGARLLVNGEERLPENGKWTVTLEELSSGAVKIGGPADWGSSTAEPHIRFKITAVSREADAADDDSALDGTGLSRQGEAHTPIGSITLEIAPLADELTIVASNRGIEDQTGGIPVTPTITLQDTDGSESLHGTVYLVTDNSHMLAGKLTLNGTELEARPVFGFDDLGNPVFTGEPGAEPVGHAYAIPADAFGFDTTTHTYSIGGLVFHPVKDSDVDVDYTIYATSREEANGHQKVTSAPGSIIIEAVADKVDLDLQGTTGMENERIPLFDDSGSFISTALKDTDGSETLTVYVTGLPAGAKLYRNQDGTEIELARTTAPVTLENGKTIPAGAIAIVITADDDPSQILGGLSLQPAPNSSADITLNIVAVTEEAANGHQAVTEGSLFIDIGTLAPTLTVGDVVLQEQTSWSNGWQTIGLDKLSATVNAADGTEKLVVYLTEVPSSIEIRVPKSGGGWTILKPDDQGRYVLNAEDLGKVQMRGTLGYDEDFTFKAQAVVYDIDVGTANESAIDSAASEIQSIDVTIQARADNARMSGSAVGLEDHWFGLKLSAETRDDSEEITSLHLKGIPEGAKLRLADGTEVEIKNGVADLSGFSKEQLAGLQMKAPADSNLDFSMTLKATTTEYGSGSDPSVSVTTRNSSHTVHVTVYGDADTPIVTVDQSVKTIDEDQLYKLSDVITNPALTDTDGSETLTIRIKPHQAGVSRLGVENAEGEIEFRPLSSDGYWELSPAELAKAYIGGVPNWASGNGTDHLKFDVVAVATENDTHLPSTGLAPDLADLRQGQAFSETQTITLTINPVADEVTIVATNQGIEDQENGIPVTPVITLQDTDGSEKLIGMVVISSSDPAMLAGKLTLNGVELTPNIVDGVATWEIPASAFGVTETTAAGHPLSYGINGLRFIPKEHSAENVSYSITATVQDTNGPTLETTGTGSIRIDAVADAPDVDIAGSFTGQEDTPIALGIDAQLVDTDGSEYLSSAMITNVPEGWQVGYVSSDGRWSLATEQPVGSGRWHLDPDKLDQVAVLPPPNQHIPAGEAPTFTLHVTATEKGDDGQIAVEHATTTKDFTIRVEAVADEPSLVVNPARTDEDKAVQLRISPALNDTDGSEVLTIYIAGDLKGGSFVNRNGEPVGTWVEEDGGRWMFTPDDLADLWFMPKADSNEDLSLTVIARATETSNGDYAERTQNLTITVKGVVDGVAPGDLLVQVQEAKDSQGAPIDLKLGDLTSLDADGSESISVVIKNIPDGVEIFMEAGFEAGMKYIGNGRWSIEAGYLDKLRATVHKDFSGRHDIAIDVVVTENDGASATFPKTLTIDVDAVADTPSISIGGGADEDAGAVPVKITVKPTDTLPGIDGPEQITEITISIDPSKLGLGDGTLSLQLGGTTYPVTAGGIEITLSGEMLAAHYDPRTGEINGLTLHGLPEHWSHNIPITVTATSSEGNGSTASRVLEGQINIQAKADGAELTVEPSAETSPSGTPIDLGIGLAFPDPSETAFLVVSDVPDGMRLNQGINTGNGIWIVPHDKADADWKLTIDGLPGTSANLTVKVVVTDIDPDDGIADHWDSLADAGISFTVPVAFEGEGSGGEPPLPPSLDVSLVPAEEDQTFKLSVVTDGDALIIHGLPEGMTITSALTLEEKLAGVVAFYQLGESYVIPTNMIDRVLLRPAQDYSGPIHLDLEATISGNYSQASSGVQNHHVAEIAPVTDGAQIAISVDAGADTREDTAGVPLTITIKALDTDFSETLVDGKLTISTDLPEGGELWLNGSKLELVDGKYTLDLQALGLDPADFQTKDGLTLGGFTLKPPANYHGALGLKASLAVQDQDAAPVTSTGSQTVTITPVTDATQLDVQDASGLEDTAIALTLSAFNPDMKAEGNAYGSEYVSVVIKGVPEGALLTNATNNGSYLGEDGKTYTSWTIKGNAIDPATGKISGVNLIPPLDFAGDIKLTVEAHSFEESNKKDIVTTQDSFTVTVIPVSDMPSISPNDVSGLEDIGVKLDLNALLTDTQEVLTVTLTGVPEGAFFTDAPEDGQALGVDHGNGTWTFTAEELANLHFVGPHNASGIFQLQASATSAHGDAAPVSTAPVRFTVTLAGVADDPVLELTQDRVEGKEDQARPDGVVDGTKGILLGISASLTDDLETLSLLITGAPEGTIFYSGLGQLIGAVDVDGVPTWVVSAEDIPGLRMVTPLDWFGEVDLTVTARSVDGTSVAEVEKTLTVAVEAVNDAPTVTTTLSGQALAGTLNRPITVVPGAIGDGSQITFADVDDTKLSRLEVRIGSGAMPGDSLGIAANEDIHIGYELDGRVILTIEDTSFEVFYDAERHCLTILGEGSHDLYAKLAESVVLTSGDGILSAGARTITLTGFDPEGAQGSVSVITTLGDSEDNPVVLTDAARGDLFWSGSGSATLAGGDGNDLFILTMGDPIERISGGDGINELFILDSAGVPGDWIFQISQDNPAVIQALSQTDDSSFLINLNAGTAIVDPHEAGRLIIEGGEDGKASGVIVFDGDTQLTFEDLDRIIT
uniref:hypothetical protein n=1 Tax=Telmatospirillum sp. J64-1 TaxID=2502183 RepID=UPI00163D46EC